MTDTKAIVKKNGAGVEPWDSRDTVRELQERLAIMIPGGAKLGKPELTALAQGAILHGLDPLNGEIWYIPGRGLMIGVKGLRKKAREQVKGNFWIDFREINSIEERKAKRIPDGALAYEARLFDSENIRAYVEAVAQMTKAGIPWESVRDILGDKPYTSGYGVLAAGEQTKMQPIQCAMKRAEADALKRRFDVPFGMKVEGVDADDLTGAPWPDDGPQIDQIQDVDYTDPDDVAAQIESERIRTEQAAEQRKRDKAALGL